MVRGVGETSFNMCSWAMSTRWGGCCVSLTLRVYLKFPISKEEKEEVERRCRGGEDKETNWTHLFTKSIPGKRKKKGAGRVF